MRTNLAFIAVILFFVLGCGSFNFNEMANKALDQANADRPAPPTTVEKEGYVASETGTEKEKPSAGRSNVQGKVLFNEKPAAGVEVKLCQKFSSMLGCRETQYSTKTDDAGEYLIKDVEPGDYEGLIVKVFDTPAYVFATKGSIISAAKYKMEPDKTFFAPATNLFKSDIKTQSPKANAKVDSAAFEAKWEPYPDAAYYKISFFATEVKALSPYINHRVEDASFKPDKAFTNGEWRMKIDAFNANNIKIAQLKDDLKFTITGGPN